MSREGRSQPIQPAAWHGFVDPGPGPVGTVPPLPTVVPLAPDRRQRFPPLPPIILSGALLSVVPPAIVAPPGPLVVIPFVDWRQRYPAFQPSFANSSLLASLVPQVVLPPGPLVVAFRERSRVLPLPPTAIHGFSAAAVATQEMGLLLMGAGA